MGHTNVLFGTPFFCDGHFRPGDVAIADGSTFRRVSVQLEVVLSGASLLPGAAHAEAVDRLERVVRDAGGISNLVQVTSALGRYVAAPAAPRKAVMAADP